MFEKENISVVTLTSKCVSVKHKISKSEKVSTMIMINFIPYAPNV